MPTTRYWIDRLDWQEAKEVAQIAGFDLISTLAEYDCSGLLEHKEDYITLLVAWINAMSEIVEWPAMVLEWLAKVVLLQKLYSPYDRTPLN